MGFSTFYFKVKRLINEHRVKRLIAPLYSDNPNARWKAIKVLRVNASVIKYLMAMLKFEDSRGEAYDVLTKIGLMDASIVEPFLIAALKKDKSSAVRGIAARVLGEIREDSLVKSLIDALESYDYDVRNRAKRALENMGDVVEPLIDALSDGNDYVRDKAKLALFHIGEQAVKPLISSMEDKNEYSRKKKYILGLIRDKKELNPDVRQAIKKALSKHRQK